MRALRVVGYGEDGVVILEDPERRERFAVPADERLRAAARGDVLRLGQMSMDLESQLRPREIQMRIRAGASVEEVASAAGVPKEKIERFAHPVLLERSRAAQMAQQAHPVRADGPDVRPLGEVVAQTFRVRGQEYTDADWDAYRNEDNKWVVALRWTVGRSDIVARWSFHPGAHGGTVTALDEHATDLVDGQQTRPLRTVGPVVDFGSSDGAETTTEAEAKPVRKPAAKTAGKPAQRSATNAPTPAASTSAASTSAASTSAASTSDGAEAQPDEQPAAASDAGDGTKRARKGKPVMPSWEDVLLGVKSQRS